MSATGGGDMDRLDLESLRCALADAQARVRTLEVERQAMELQHGELERLRQGVDQEHRKMQRHHEALESQRHSMERQNRELEHQRQAMEEKLQDREHQLKLLKRCLFGSRSENGQRGGTRRPH